MFLGMKIKLHMPALYNVHIAVRIIQFTGTLDNKNAQLQT